MSSLSIILRTKTIVRYYTKARKVILFTAKCVLYTLPTLIVMQENAFDDSAACAGPSSNALRDKQGRMEVIKNVVELGKGSPRRSGKNECEEDSRWLDDPPPLPTAKSSIR